MAMMTMMMLLMYVAVCAAEGSSSVGTNQTLVKAMAENLLNGSFNAGSGYADVWIRDTSTFLSVAAQVNKPGDVKRVLMQFLAWQRADGEVPGGYTPNAKPNHTCPASFWPCLGGTPVCKNTAETDQESSLVIAFSHYVNATQDKAVLGQLVDGTTVIKRLELALQWLLKERLDNSSGLIYGGTTMDWGDVQPEAGLPDERMLSPGSHPSLDVYDNALFVLAVRALVHLRQAAPDGSLGPAAESPDWPGVIKTVSSGVRNTLWDAAAKRYRPHVYLSARGSPFPADFDEGAHFCSGSTFVAAQAGLLTRQEFLDVLLSMQANVAEVNAAGGAVTLGMTIYPPYPSAFPDPSGKGNLTNLTMMPEWTYQNGGDWAWFGGRLVQALVSYGLLDDAEYALKPMVDRVVEHDGFYEWWGRDGSPQGSKKFHGAAGVLGQAIDMLEHAKMERRSGGTG